MRLVRIFFCWVIPTLPLYAAPWSFDEPVDVTQTTGPRIFHHLESAGRKNIAVSDNIVAVTWEDERDGVPRVYLARKQLNDKGFSKEIAISGSGEAFEPSITALPGDRFALAWEEDGKIIARLVGPGDMGPALILTKNGAQANVTADGENLYVLASDSGEQHSRIYLYHLATKHNLTLKTVDQCPVDTAAAKDDQLYPTAVIKEGHLLVAWEDRRPGHTIIMSAWQKNTEACAFLKPLRVSLRPEARPNLPYGKGHGVSRVALTSFGKNEVMAAWADKRDFREGYDIYASEHEVDGKFGENLRVQDDFGGQARQWHTAIAGHTDGQVVVAWDDNRESNADVMLSWMEQNAWSDDLPLPGGSGPGEQNHPSLILDRDGNIHVAWLERDTVNGPTRLRYSLGRLKKQE